VTPEMLVGILYAKEKNCPFNGTINDRKKKNYTGML
jgi:hypothetical protein